MVIPESPIRAPGTINWTGAILLSLWLVCLLLRDQRGADVGMALGARARSLRARRRGRRRLGQGGAASSSPLVDMHDDAAPGRLDDQPHRFLIGFGMYSSFVLIPQFVETPKSNGYGFGSSVTQAGIFLIPST